MDLTQVNLITIDEQKNQGRFVRRDAQGSETGLVGRIGLPGMITCGTIEQGQWKLLAFGAYPGLEVNSVPDAGTPSIVRHYMALPEEKPPTGIYLAFTQQITATTMLFIPLAVPEGDEMEEWHTYYVRNS